LLSGGAGFVGSACVLFGSSQPGSPFTVQARGAWFFGSADPSSVSADHRFIGIMLVYVGIALLLGSWYEVVRVVRSPTGSALRPLVAVLAAWVAPLAFCAPLFSRDVYSYAAQGEMVTKGISPYVHGPSALGRGPFLPLVDPLWRQVPSPYGSAWERLSGWIVALCRHHVLASLVGFRLVALVGVALVAWGIPVLARSVGRDPSTAFALAVLNPLVLLELVGGAHNDALMLGLLVAGCALALQKHLLAGLVLCALAAEVKIPGLIGAVFIGWWWAGSDVPWRRRLLPLALSVAGTAAVMASVVAVSGLGGHVVTGLSNPGAVVSWLDPATGVGLLLARLASVFGLGGHQTGFVHGARIVGLGLAALVSIRLLVRSERTKMQALGGSLLAIVLLGPVVWPWYETWGLVFLGVVAEGWILAAVIVLSAVASVADVPRPGLLTSGTPVLVVLVWAALAAAVGLYLVRRVGPTLFNRPLDGRARVTQA
jgi:alpha-1,6-mannosyltransferase